MRIIALVLLLVAALGAIAEAQVSVDGYTRRDGTYVRPHQRTRPNDTIRDNYNYPGNWNPNTGRITPGDPYRRDTDRDGIPDALDPTPYGTRSRSRGSGWGR